MDKEKIKAEFHEFIDTASEKTLRDFVKFMKERRRANEKISSRINEILNFGEDRNEKLND